MNLNQSLTFHCEFDWLEKSYVSLIKNWKRISLHIVHSKLEWWEYRISWIWKIVLSTSNITVHMVGWNIFCFNEVDKISDISYEGWSWKKTIVKSESAIRDELFSNDKRLKAMISPDLYLIWKEFVLEWYWRIDILWKIGEDYLIIELKKWKSTFNAIDQALRYVNRFEELWHTAMWVVIVKDIQEDHKKYADELGIDLIKLT